MKALLEFLKSRNLGNASHTLWFNVAYGATTFTYIQDSMKHGLQVWNMVAYASVMGIFASGNKLMELWATRGRPTDQAPGAGQ